MYGLINRNKFQQGSKTGDSLCFTARAFSSYPPSPLIYENDPITRHTDTMHGAPTQLLKFMILHLQGRDKKDASWKRRRDYISSQLQKM